MTPIQIATCQNLFDNNPTPTAIFHAASLKLEHANPAILKLWDRTSDIIGLSLLDFMPELADQQYPELLKNVRYTNKAHQEYGAEVKINKGDKLNSVYMDYSYSPIGKASSLPTGVLVIATETMYSVVRNI